MRLVRLSTLALALLAFGAFGTAAASAEETGILCLVAGCQNLEGTLKSSPPALSRFVALRGARNLVAETAEAVLKNCEAVAGTEEKHVTLCKDVPITFTGVVVEESIVKCNTEGEAAGRVKVLVDAHMAAELSASKMLEPLVLIKLLNAKLEAKEVAIKCGAALILLLKGTLGCLLLPGLANVAVGGAVEIRCAQKEKDPVSGECELLCEWLKETPFEGNFGGGFEDMWIEMGPKGTLNKDVFIDD